MNVFLNRAVALYLRISIDRSGRKEGVEAQERRGRAFAEAEWPGVPVVIYCDNDLTAADPNVERPEFERLRADVRHGRIAHIWAIEFFRVVRQPVEWFPFSEELEAAGIEYIHTHRDGMVRVGDDVSDIKVVMGGGEVRRTKRRVRDYSEDMAKRGLPPGSRPWGYRHAKIKGIPTYEIVPEQAEALRWAAEQILEYNWSLSRCVKEMQRRGLKGAHTRRVLDPDTGEPVVDIDTGEPVKQSTEITSYALKSSLTSPSTAGLRVHRGEIVGKANWHERAILTEEQRQRLLVKLGGTRTVTTIDGHTYPVPAPTGKGSRARRYLLTGGTAVCGECEAPLIASMKQLKSATKPSAPYYLCHPHNGGHGCIGIMGDRMEAYVVETMMTELAKPGRIETYLGDKHADRRAEITAELGDIEVRRSDLATMWGARDITTDEWKAMKSGLDESESRLRAEMADVPPPPVDFDPRALLDPRVWSGLELDEKRGWIQRFIASVTVVKATTPYNVWKPEQRITIDWK